MVLSAPTIIDVSTAAILGIFLKKYLNDNLQTIRRKHLAVKKLWNRCKYTENGSNVSLVSFSLERYN